MSAQDILAKRMGEVNARKDAEREAVKALFAAYPEIAAFAADMKETFPGQITRFKWAINGPINDRREWVQPVIGGHTVPDKRGKR